MVGNKDGDGMSLVGYSTFCEHKRPFYQLDAITSSFGQ
jgi:hypothetical protein